ncbi:hypothetical protein ABZ471_23760 [Streptomyces sp. NPDC005728]|uniref:hypothetical protein n=1 Tax=Streptomyces sp. NPDC005728 TaxID=3157054 RepID=UPI0033F9F2DA
MSATALQGLPRTVLRLHRTALLVWAAAVVAPAGWLVYLNEVTAPATRRAERACAHVDVCTAAFDSFDYSGTVGWTATLIGYSYLAVAAFAGGALIGRELESGTAHLAWTQGVTPARWLTAKLALPALAVAAGGLALVLVFRWGWSANEDLLTTAHWYEGAVFVARGPLTVAYGLCALALGALTALLLRRTLPALGTAVAATWLTGFLLGRYRADLWPALTRTWPSEPDLPAGTWRVNWGRNADGYFAVYHPASHFWPLQSVETGIVLTATVLATIAGYAVLRRRAA